MKKTWRLILGAAILITAATAGAYAVLVVKFIRKRLKISSVYQQYYALMSQWVSNKIQNTRVADTLISRGYKNIGVYGMGTIMSTLVSELEGSDISIKFFADKNTEKFYESDIPVIPPEKIPDYYDDIDAIIVTPIGYYEEICDELRRIGAYNKAVSLSGIIYPE